METFSLIPALGVLSDGYVWFLHGMVMVTSAIVCGFLAWLDVRTAIADGYHIKSRTEDEEVSHHEPIIAPPSEEAWGYRKVA